MRILIVEDEDHLAYGLKLNCEAEGYQVDVVNNGPAALEIFNSAEPGIDLVILDLMLPGMSGYEICRLLREEDPWVRILVLTARTLSEDKTRAFDCGTDQYMTKPFELPELIARVRNLLDRQTAPRPIPEEYERVVEFGDARVDFRRHHVTVGGVEKKLTNLELKLLKLFVENEGVVLSRSEILEKVWDLPTAPATRTVDNFVLRLRKHFETDPAEPRYFLSVRGAGYKFDSSPSEEETADEKQ